jgi:putative acetyltransferase
MPSDTALAVEIRSLLPGDDATAFRTLNEEWINRYFTLEAKDRETLSDPENTILLKGGHIFMVYAGVEPVGCVALIPISDGVYELSKMAVSPRLRGRGIGRRLLQHAIGQARLLGARSLFLGSSTKLPGAIHLYESIGFRHVPPETLPPMPHARANVFMEMALYNERAFRSGRPCPSPGCLLPESDRGSGIFLALRHIFQLPRGILWAWSITIVSSGYHLF